jgi:hypothetical protein
MSKIYGITPQTQPTPVTCVQTCIAMAMEVPVEKIIERYGGDALNQELLTMILTQCGILWNRFSQGTLIYEGWYFAVVPSLNTRGANHQVLLRWTSDDGLTVLDPSSKETYKQDGSDIKTWTELTPFWPGGTLPDKV